jgi:NAD-dependent deacetylase
MRTSEGVGHGAGCAELIRNARSTVVMTGAGISTPAGIPDFRGPAGLYATGAYDPDLVFNGEYFQRDPLLFYEFTRDFMTLLKGVRPTFSHYALAALERCGLLSGVITQNIDGLHHLAGSRSIVELHGSYWSATCPGCGAWQLREGDCDWWEHALRTGPRPPIVSCPVCAGVVKPSVVFFGEVVTGLDAATAMVAGCDLLLVLGSSLTVYPAALLPQLAQGAVVVVSRGTVQLAPAPNRYFIDEELDGFLRQVMAALAVPVPEAP